ncbi:MAG: hypothetical protein GY705_02915 [Bacteroidetes bacterium]|nr:hypothetical protein [Bacteroidota bacterium]
MTNKILAGALSVCILFLAFRYWQHTGEERLFLEHFLPADNELTITMRGEGLPDEHPELETALNYYEAGNYANSIPHFEKYLSEREEDFAARFYAGVACLEEYELNKAIEYLSSVRINNEDYYEDATWYLALANVRNKDNGEATLLLDNLINNESPYYHKKAQELKQNL